jgi:YIF1
MLGAGHSFVEQNYAKYLSGAGCRSAARSCSLSVPAGNELRYYFTVNSRYVVNKLKLLLFPFALKGHWARSHEQVAGGAKFKPPAHDINAPDLYIPLLAFCTYCLVCCMVDIASASSKFKPEACQPSARTAHPRTALTRRARSAWGASPGGASLRGRGRRCYCGRACDR